MLARRPQTETASATNMQPPRAFISYSWDDDQHNAWVSNLATDLRRDGVETRLDEWHTAFGDQFTAFMEREIRENDFVLVVCTPNYRLKSDRRTGGVGYEGDIMTAEVAERGNHRKYIPVLARGSWRQAAPSWLKGKKYADLRTKATYRSNYPELAATLLGTTPTAPPIGRSSDSVRPLSRNTVRRPTAEPTDPMPPRDDGVSSPVTHEEPIRILEVDTDQITAPPMDGTPGSALYTVPLRLNRQPSRQWADLFVATWNRPPRFSTMHRPGIATVRGVRIVLDGTTLEEIEKHHRDTLTLCVNVANQKEAELLQLRRQEEERRQRQIADHRKEVEDRSKKLSFD